MTNRNFRQIINLLDLHWQRRISVIHQTGTAECGLACLATTCGHFGKSIDLIYLRQKFNLSARGAALAGINGVAEQPGMTTRVFSLELDELRVLKAPCILHWDFSHFVVLVSVEHNRYVLHGPARGIRYISREEMSRYFTGVALEVWPGSESQSETLQTRTSPCLPINSIYGIKRTSAKISRLSVVIKAVSLLMSVGMQLVMDHIIPMGDRGLLTLIPTAFTLFILLKAATSTLYAWSSLIVSTFISVQRQPGSFDHLLRLLLAFSEHRRLGDIQSRFDSPDTLRVTSTINVIGFVMDSTMVVGVCVMILLYGGYLTWVVLCFTTIYVFIRLVTYDSY